LFFSFHSFGYLISCIEKLKVNEVEEDLNIMGRKKNTGMKWLETVGNGGRLYGKPRSTTDCNGSTKNIKTSVKSGGIAY
jgi:hypothetical protein